MTSVYITSVHCQFGVLVALSSKGITLAVGGGGCVNVYYNFDNSTLLHWKFLIRLLNWMSNILIQLYPFWPSSTHCCHNKNRKERLLAGDIGRTGFIEENGYVNRQQVFSPKVYKFQVVVFEAECVPMEQAVMLEQRVTILISLHIP